MYTQHARLTAPIPFKAVSILLSLAVKASFFLVLRFPRFDSSKIHSCPPDLQRCGVSLGHDRRVTSCRLTLQGAPGPDVSSGMQRILILRHLRVSRSLGLHSAASRYTCSAGLATLAAFA